MGDLTRNTIYGILRCMEPSIVAYVDEKLKEIREERGGWGRVCIVMERGRVVCIESTDSEKVRETSCK